MTRQKPIRKAVFPVGGLGTRFLPATKSSPKEMLPVIDKPLILYAVEEALAAGVEQLIFVTGRGKTAIEDFFDYSYELNTELARRGKPDELSQVRDFILKPGQITYIRQQEPLGLGHAVWCARHLIQDEPFAVLLADDLILSATPCLTQMIHAYEGGNMVAALDVPPSQVQQYGILDIAQRHGSVVYARDIVEKPTPDKAPSGTAVIGRYVLDSRIFDVLERVQKGVGGEIQLTDAIKQMTQAGIPLSGFHYEGRRFDCGHKQGLLEATIAYALARPDLRDGCLSLLKYYGTQEHVA